MIWQPSQSLKYFVMLCIAPRLPICLSGAECLVLLLYWTFDWPARSLLFWVFSTLCYCAAFDDIANSVAREPVSLGKFLVTVRYLPWHRSFIWRCLNVEPILPQKEFGLFWIYKCYSGVHFKSFPCGGIFCRFWHIYIVSEHLPAANALKGT